MRHVRPRQCVPSWAPTYGVVSHRSPGPGRSYPLQPPRELSPMTMTQAPSGGVKQLVLSTAAFGPREIDQIIRSISENFANYRELREAVQELEEQTGRSPATAARLGVCLYLLGRYS